MALALRENAPWAQTTPRYHPTMQNHIMPGDMPLGRNQQRRTIDYAGTVIRMVQNRMIHHTPEDEHYVPPTPAGLLEMMPPPSYPHAPITSLCAKFVHVSSNKRRFPVHVTLWTPDGRRLITGAQNGELTLWNGMSFNFESALMAHEGNAVRSMTYTHNDNWLVTGDDAGSIKYWQSNLNHVKVLEAHRESVRAVSFSKSDLKFTSCSDDTTVKVWDFKECKAEQTLTGHGSDVKSVHWHPRKSLLASGSKDSLVKLWDPKAGKCVYSIHGHKNAVTSVQWNNNGNWLLTGSRDQLCRVFDIRMMRALAAYKGQNREVSSVTWHPHHEELFVSGGMDGSLMHWLVGYEQAQAEARGAHEGPVWSLAFHPVGHILCSGSNDCSAKFWCRNRPGEIPRDGGARGHGPVEGAQFGSRPVTARDHSNVVRPSAAAAAIPGVGAAQRPATAAAAALSHRSQPPPQPQRSGGSTGTGSTAAQSHGGGNERRDAGGGGGGGGYGQQQMQQGGGVGQYGGGRGAGGGGGGWGQQQQHQQQHQQQQGWSDGRGPPRAMPPPGMGVGGPGMMGQGGYHGGPGGHGGMGAPMGGPMGGHGGMMGGPMMGGGMGGGMGGMQGGMGMAGGMGGMGPNQGMNMGGPPGGFPPGGNPNMWNQHPRGGPMPPNKRPRQ